MNKFEKMLGANEALQRRTTALSQTAEIAQQNVVNKLKAKKAELELEIFNLTDLAPESSDSLRPGSKNWNAEQWAKTLQEKKQDLYTLNIQIKLAEDTLKEYFTEIDD